MAKGNKWLQAGERKVHKAPNTRPGIRGREQRVEVMQGGKPRPQGRTIKQGQERGEGPRESRLRLMGAIPFEGQTWPREGNKGRPHEPKDKHTSTLSLKGKR